MHDGIVACRWQVCRSHESSGNRFVNRAPRPYLHTRSPSGVDVMSSASGYAPTFSGPEEAEKLAALRRTKAIATGALCLCVAVFALAKYFESQVALALLRRRIRRSRDDRRHRRLVCRGRAVPAAARPADSAHRDHPREPESHRRQSRPLHRGEFPRARTGARKAAGGRFRSACRGLAVRSGAGRGAVALRHPARAANADRRRTVRPARLRQAADARRDREGEDCAARCRPPGGLHRRSQTPETVRRIHQGRRPISE